MAENKIGGFSLDDVHVCAKHNKISISEEQAEEVFRRMFNFSDPDVGMSMGLIKSIILDVIEDS